MFERQSALAGALKSGGRDGAHGQRKLRIGEARGWSLVQIAAFTTTLPDLEKALRPVVHADLPDRVGEVVDSAGWRLLKTAAEQFWILTPEGDDPVLGIQAAVPPTLGAVTALSNSRTCIVIEGTASRELLSKGIALDLDRDVFHRGRFALTGLHHTPILIYRGGENRYELYALRTFALSVWEWLIDAALPFGYDIVSDISSCR